MPCQRATQLWSGFIIATCKGSGARGRASDGWRCGGHSRKTGTLHEWVGMRARMGRALERERAGRAAPPADGA
eukprot:scaffold35000_cov112-Isochrysis_galbana.AAC.1